MPRLANTKDIPALKSLWHTVFGDDYKMIDMFFDDFFTPDSCVVCDQCGEIASMLFLLPCTAVVNGRRHSLRYVYAVATLPQYRGRGLARCAIGFAERLACEKGCAGTVLKPETEQLFEFYRRQGYLTQAAWRRVGINAAEVSSEAPLTVLPLSAGEFFSMREKCLSKTAGYVSFDEHYLAHALREYEFYGVKALKLSSSTGHGYAVCYIIDSVAVVKELCVSNELARSAVKTLLTVLGADRAEICLPRDSTIFAGKEKVSPCCMGKFIGSVRDKANFSLCHRLGCEDIYMNIVLD